MSQRTSGRVDKNVDESENRIVCETNDGSTKVTGGYSSASRFFLLTSASAANTDACEYSCVTYEEVINQARFRLTQRSHLVRQRVPLGVRLAQADEQLLDLRLERGYLVPQKVAVRRCLAVCGFERLLCRSAFLSLLSSFPFCFRKLSL